MRKFKENVPLAKFTNYKIGGPARFFFEAKTEADIRWAVARAKFQKLPCFILGGGTNLLMSDAGFRGLVLRINIGGISAKKNILTTGAGISMERLTVFATKRSLAGLEWAGGLPGTLGGAIRGNAGCFGGEMKDVVRTVRSFNTKTMRSVTRTAAQCSFGYRTSIFKQRPGEIIISAALRMKKGDRKKISAALKTGKTWRAARHPLEHPSAGSVFKNVPLAKIYRPGSKAYLDAVRKLSTHYRGSSFSVKTDPVPVIAAAKLIGESGLTGKRAGGGMISPKHTNFIVNVRRAKAKDILSLIALAKKQVYRKFGILLEEEIQIVSADLPKKHGTIKK
jgi:UDP-N-acetylmuramate dehydrogenase